MQGYFIRLGDRTSCGGQVIEATTDTMMDGLPQARLGDTVTCGATGGLYRIEGGVSWDLSDGLPVAGTLDSTSSCPCRASLYHSYQYASYEQTSVQAVSFTSTQPASLRPDTPPTTALPLSKTQSSGPFSGCFQLLDQHARPCASHGYALLDDGHCLDQCRLDSEGRSQLTGGTRPARIQIATNAPAPVLE